MKSRSNNTNVSSNERAIMFKDMWHATDFVKEKKERENDHIVDFKKNCNQSKEKIQSR